MSIESLMMWFYRYIGAMMFVLVGAASYLLHPLFLLAIPPCVMLNVVLWMDL